MLHLVNGKDYFISVSGYLVQTSFGRKITDLVRIPDPIRRQNLLVDIEQVRTLALFFILKLGLQCKINFLSSDSVSRNG